MCSFNGCFQWMVFNSIKEIQTLRKEMNRLLNEGMSNICLKVAIEKRWRTQNFNTLEYSVFNSSILSSSPGQFLGSSNSRINFQTSCCKLKITGLGAKLCVMFLYFYFARSPWLLLNKNIKFDKNETESKMEHPTQF